MIPFWQTDYIDKLNKMTNQELWNEFLNVQLSEDYLEYEEPNGKWYREKCHEIIEQRLEKWLEDVK